MEHNSIKKKADNNIKNYNINKNKERDKNVTVD